MTNFLSLLTSVATLTLAVVPLSAIGSVAHAAEARIQVGDLDLSRASDAERFVQRVDMAARTVCTQLAQDPSQMGACRRAVREEAVEKLGSAQRQALRASGSNRRVASAY